MKDPAKTSLSAPKFLAFMNALGRQLLRRQSRVSVECSSHFFLEAKKIEEAKVSEQQKTEADKEARQRGRKAGAKKKEQGNAFSKGV